MIHETMSANIKYNAYHNTNVTLQCLIIEDVELILFSVVSENMIIVMPSIDAFWRSITQLIELIQVECINMYIECCYVSTEAPSVDALVMLIYN